jgi:hypothetical protein
MNAPTRAELARLLNVVLSPPEIDDAGNREAALTLYLFLPLHVGSIRYRSSLEALLRDARGAVGRDLDSGAVLHPDHSRSWLGTMGYLALIDQVSNLLDVPPDPELPKGASNFEALLHWDGYVLADEAAALYALRCSFVHNYGLLNNPRGRVSPVRAPSLTHMFELGANGGTEVVKLGRRDFDNDTPIAEISPTFVDLRSVVDLCEQLISNLRSKHLAGDGLPIRASIPLHEFKRACFFAHPDPIDMASAQTSGATI